MYTKRRWTFEGGCLGGVSAAIANYIACMWVQAVLADENVKYPATNAIGMAVFGAAVGMTSGVFIKPVHAAIVGAVLGSLPMFAKLAIIGGGIPQPLLIYLASLIVVGALAGAAGSLFGERIYPSDPVDLEDSEELEDIEE